MVSLRKWSLRVLPAAAVVIAVTALGVAAGAPAGVAAVVDDEARAVRGGRQRARPVLGPPRPRRPAPDRGTEDRHRTSWARPMRPRTCLAIMAAGLAAALIPAGRPASGGEIPPPPPPAASPRANERN